MEFRFTKHARYKFLLLKRFGFLLTEDKVKQTVKNPLKTESRGENNMKYKYDKDADILAVTISKEPFDYAEEMGDFIVHFSKKNKPVYIEILNASSFLNKAQEVIPSSASN